jgi:hypothetical protein
VRSIATTPASTAAPAKTATSRRLITAPVCRPSP